MRAAGRSGVEARRGLLSGTHSNREAGRRVCYAHGLSRRSGLSAPRVALVTCANLPQLTPDDRLLADALRDRGVDPVPAVWDEPATDWRSFHRVVLRSPWDYHLRPREFAAWLDAREGDGVRMVNPAPLVRWNVHKSYLSELARAGVPVLETVGLPRGRASALAALMDARGWADVVVKPAVSASAHRTFRVSRADAASLEESLDAILRDGDALVQPLAPEVLEQGEWSIVFLGGRFSHAVLKRGAAGEFRVQEEFGGRAETRDPGGALLPQAEAALQAAPGPTAYARVDGIERDGRFVLMELELVEPVLYLGRDPEAPGRLADAIL